MVPRDPIEVHGAVMGEGIVHPQDPSLELVVLVGNDVALAAVVALVDPYIVLWIIVGSRHFVRLITVIENHYTVHGWQFGLVRAFISIK